MSEQMTAAAFLSSRPKNLDPMFKTPVGYTGWRYVVRQAAAGSVAIAAAFVALPGLASSGAWWAYPVVVGAGAVYVSALTRMELIREGRPRISWFPPRSKPIEENAGRTFLPEYAQYQKALDKVALEKQAKRPKLLKGRHDKRDAQGRFAS